MGNICILVQYSTVLPSTSYTGGSEERLLFNNASAQSSASEENSNKVITIF
jgi:hypothetical protein